MYTYMSTYLAMYFISFPVSLTDETSSLVFVFSFALSHSRSLSCMRTCHSFRDRYCEPTETNLFFQAIRGHNDPEYRQIILRSCYHAAIHSEVFLRIANILDQFS